MRNNGFDEISQWAPSLLNGDNAKFDFGNWPGSITPELRAISKIDLLQRNVKD